MTDIFNNVVEVIGVEGLREAMASGRKLRIKCGFDPTSVSMHLGHMVLLRKLRQFQELGHQVIFLIGDFTARIGDPTGRNIERPALSDEDIANNVAQFKQQVFKILDPEKTEVRHNSEWLEQRSAELIKLMSTVTLSQMLEREDFNSRFDREQPIRLHELVYPLLQGFDSVALRADVELGGTDQKFNLLMGRSLQRHFEMTPQAIIMMPLINGVDGAEKMSKSLNNHIGLADAPVEQFGRIMSIPDDLMEQYRVLLTDLPESGASDGTQAETGRSNCC
jgi:tyrosyl-tRNA synthetase